jgi:Flp pilus assembly pilin Flp
MRQKRGDGHGSRRFFDWGFTLMLKLLVQKALYLWKDDEGADLVEYALLASMVALAGVLVFPSIGAKLGAAFATWSGNVYNDVWEPSDPQ